MVWGDSVIPIYGSLDSVPFDGTKIANQVIMVKAQQNGKIIYQIHIRTDNSGRFNTSFFPPNDGTITVTARILTDNSTAATIKKMTPVDYVINIVSTEAWMPFILILFFAMTSFLIVIVFTLFYPKDNIAKLSIIPGVIFVVLAYYIFYKFPPLDTDTGNTALAAVLLTPIIAYVYEILKIKVKPGSD